MKIHIYDAHQDIAGNIQLVSQKDFFKKHAIHDCFIKSKYACVNQVDYPRLVDGNVSLVFATIFAQTKQQALEQFKIYEDIISQGEQIVPILSADDILSLKSNQIGFLLNMEGAAPIETVDDLDSYYSLGLRSIGISWRGDNKYINGDIFSKEGNLLLKKIEEKKLIIDAAHMSEALFYDLAEKYSKPFIVSHTACSSLHSNERNISDEQITLLKKRGGLVGIAGVNKLVGGTSIDDMVKHFIHVANKFSVDTLCIGSDFDGMVNPELSLIEGFEDVSCYPNLLMKLREHLSLEDVHKIAHSNLREFIIKLL